MSGPGPSGAGLQPLKCRVCEAPCGDGAHDPGRCANCYNLGIVGFNRGRVIVEYPIQEYVADTLNALPTERALELTAWVWAILTASARSEIEGR